jgi:hypothetical protein
MYFLPVCINGRADILEALGKPPFSFGHDEANREYNACLLVACIKKSPRNYTRIEKEPYLINKEDRLEYVAAVCARSPRLYEELNAFPYELFSLMTQKNQSFIR